ncbi:hypothetical protein MUP29_10740 [bacterium]|nr:hypothetical protein [bacterium]
MDRSEHLNGFTFEQPGVYRIRVLGELDQEWSGRLGGMSITVQKKEGRTPITFLDGPLRDQAELMGTLSSLYEFHMAILSVECLSKD